MWFHGLSHDLFVYVCGWKLRLNPIWGRFCRFNDEIGSGSTILVFVVILLVEHTQHQNWHAMRDRSPGHEGFIQVEVCSLNIISHFQAYIVWSHTFYETNQLICASFQWSRTRSAQYQYSMTHGQNVSNIIMHDIYIQCWCLQKSLKLSWQVGTYLILYEPAAFYWLEENPWFVKIPWT